MNTANLEQAQLEAERAGLTLLNDEQGLALTAAEQQAGPLRAEQALVTGHGDEGRA